MQWLEWHLCFCARMFKMVNSSVVSQEKVLLAILGSSLPLKLKFDKVSEERGIPRIPCKSRLRAQAHCEDQDQAYPLLHISLAKAKILCVALSSSKDTLSNVAGRNIFWPPCLRPLSTQPSIAPCVVVLLEEDVHSFCPDIFSSAPLRTNSRCHLPPLGSWIATVLRSFLWFRCVSNMGQLPEFH